MVLRRHTSLTLALPGLFIAALAPETAAQIAVSGVFEWNGTALRDTGQRVKVNGGPAAIRIADK